MQGRVHRLIRGKGFGFIQAEERQYFFHHSEVREAEFRHLMLGDVVDFQGVDEEDEGKNPRATEVHVVEKAPSPPPGASRFSHKKAGAPEPGGSPGVQGEPEELENGESFDSAVFIDEDDEFSEELPYGSEEAQSESSETTSESRTSSPSRSGSRGRSRGGRGRRGSVRDAEKSRRPKATGKAGELGEGVVRSLNMARGFGFIETRSGDLFFHKSGVKGDFDTLSVGSQVSFTFGEGDQGSKAENVAVS